MRNIVRAGLIMAVASVAGFANAADAPPVIDMKTCDKPAYPRASLANEEQGVVIVAFLVGVDGKVVESKVEKSSGFRNLDKAAMTSLGLCKFKPGTKDGKPEQGWAKVEYAWKLD